MEPLVIIAIIALVWWAISAATKKAKQAEQRRLAEKARGQTAEACTYIEEVNRTRAFQTVLMQNVNSQKGEFGLLGETSTLFETKARSYRLYAGTRVKLGKMPLYLGGSKPVYYEDLVAAGEGDLHLSNQRIIFLSDKRSSAVALRDVVGIDASLDSITIHTSKRQKPFIFTVRNPAMWALLVKIASAEGLATPNLPAGRILHAEPTANPGEVHFSARQDGLEVTLPTAGG